MSVLQVVAWFAYLVPTMILFFLPGSSVRKDPSKPVEETVSA
jgi:high-affinity Fe2+/Pb2+ permease